MTIIPKDPYADELLLNVTVLKSGLSIKRDAYADLLLNYTQEVSDSPVLPVDGEAPEILSDESGKEKT